MVSAEWFTNGRRATRITCSLSLGLVDTSQPANHQYYIIKPKETTFRSLATPEQRLGLFTHRDLSLDWNTRLTRVGRVRCQSSPVHGPA